MPGVLSAGCVIDCIKSVGDFIPVIAAVTERPLQQGKGVVEGGGCGVAGV
jgi:hypothetical protein